MTVRYRGRRSADPDRVVALSELDAKATTTTTDALDGRLTTAESDIDALEAGVTPLSNNPELNLGTTAASTVATNTLAGEIDTATSAITVLQAAHATPVTLTGTVAAAESPTDAEIVTMFDTASAPAGAIGAHVTPLGIRRLFTRTASGVVRHERETPVYETNLPSAATLRIGDVIEHVTSAGLWTRWLVNAQGDLEERTTVPAPEESRLVSVPQFLFATDGAGSVATGIDSAFASGTLELGDLIETRAFLPTPFGYELASLRGGCQYVLIDSGATEETGRFYIPGTGYKLRAVFSNDCANPYQFGALGNRTGDDTTALQAMFDCLCISFGKADFQSAQCLVSSTLTLTKLRSFSVVGNGVVTKASSVFNDAFPLMPASIVWNGASGGTVVECSSAFFYWSGVSIFGSSDEGAVTGARAGCLFKFRAVAGIGSGAAQFGFFAGGTADTCFQFGDASGEANCADISFQSLFITRFGVGMTFKSDQNVNYVIGHADFTFGETAFLFEGGGSLNVQHLHFVETNRILHLDSQSFGIGSNNATYRFGFIKSDATQTLTPEIVYSEGGGTIHIDIQNLLLGASHKDDARFLFTIRKSTVLNVSNASVLNASRKILDVTDGDTVEQAIATFDSCRITGSDADNSPSNWEDNPLAFLQLYSYFGFRQARVRFVNCFNSGSRLLPDVSFNAPRITQVRPVVVDKRGAGAFSVSRYDMDRTYYIDGVPSIPYLRRQMIGAWIKFVNFTTSDIAPSMEASTTLDPDGLAAIPANGTATLYMISDTDTSTWRLMAS